MMKQYTIGIDFGTLSGRCVLVDCENGKELAEAVCNYAHGVMDVYLPSGKKLPPNYALQHPADYIEVLQTAIPDAIKKSGINRSAVTTVIAIPTEPCRR